MPLIIGLVALVGAALLLTSGITDASFADVATGKAGEIFRGNPPPGGGTGGAGGNPAGADAAPSGSQRQQIRQAAAAHGLSPLTLWGVFGTESGFGRNLGPSSAGAEGPFQFLPGTFAEWGTGNINNFTDALDAAASYLSGLGANSDPSSPQTIAALNRYNGNRGGTSVTSYASSVLKLGAGF